MAKHVTQETFDQEVIKSSVPVLVDFWAEWCGPCRMLGPILDDVANDMGEKISIVKVNVDENPAIASGFGIQSIPAMFIFKGGEIVGHKVGLLQKHQLIEWIHQTI